MGGGDLVGQFYDAGLLDEIIVQIASVTLGSGKQLLPRSITKPPLRLSSVDPFGPGLVELRYEVPPPLRVSIRPNLSLNATSPACPPAPSTSRILGFAQRLGAGEAGYLHSLSLPRTFHDHRFIKGTEHYVWAENCDGWHLLKDPTLHIIQESVPPGKSEHRHLHSVAQQFFFILTGQTIMEVEGQDYPLSVGEGIHIGLDNPINSRILTIIRSSS